MRRIATILKASEAATVRKAVTEAGATLVIVTPLARHANAVNLGQWFCDGTMSGADQPVRLEALAEDANATNIVSVILAHARSGGIENIIPFPSGKPVREVLPEAMRQVANG